MPNRSSSAGHVPQRTCVICRRKTARHQLIRFVLLGHKAVFDIDDSLPGRGWYVCDANSCLEKLTRWLKKRSRRKHG
ncbi:MAG: DUF448 domain-containing protein [Candidatus Cloacimonetes bacterium]|nr:DUF448 domain-containing protein [Candidatus Cloacimonadota bacterium]